MEIVKKFGPYLAVELLLPGGTVIALLLYVIRERKFLSGALSILGPAIRLGRSSPVFALISRR